MTPITGPEAAAIVAISASGGQFLRGFVDAEAARKVLRARLDQYANDNIRAVFGRASQLLSEIGEAPREIAPQRLVPTVEGASLEDDPALQDLWAALVANEAPSVQEHHDYAQILRQLTSLDAYVLNHIAGAWPELPTMALSLRRSKSVLAGLAARLCGNTRGAIVQSVLTQRNSSAGEASAALDNLERLGLIRTVTNGSDSEHGIFAAAGEAIGLTALGFYFITSGRPPVRAAEITRADAARP